MAGFRSSGEREAIRNVGDQGLRVPGLHPSGQNEPSEDTVGPHPLEVSRQSAVKRWQGIER